MLGKRLFVFLLAALLAPEVAVPQEAGPALLLILDASGSMWGQIEGENKIVIARRVVGDLVDGLDSEAQIGVVAYGHRREGDCDDIETVAPIGALDRAAIQSTVDGLNPKGKTPITQAVEHAFGVIAGRSAPTTVVLVSDGLETCGGDPCAAVRAAKQRGASFLLHVIGFDVAGEDVSQLECAAQAGEGLFLSAESADELAGALERAATLTPEVPAGRLAVTAVADGELQDAAVLVTDAASGDEAGNGRTYASPETNPRVIPLPDGTFDVTVEAVGIRGDATRRFQVEIADGGRVEREVDFSTGELVIGVTRNGEPSDAVFRVSLPDGGEVASGRTYTARSSNPASVRLTAGDYAVSLKSVEISGDAEHGFGVVTVAPQGRAELAHEFASGTLRVGAARGGELVDATLSVVDAASGKPVAQGRTYTSERSNPKSFMLQPGDYRVTVKEIRGAGTEISVSLEQGQTVERMVDPSGGG